MTNKTKAAIEEAAKLPTALEVFNKHTNQRMMHDPYIIAAMQEYADSHTAAHAAALRERVKELEERLSEERFHTMGFSDALGGANFRLDTMKAENTRYREALEAITRIFGNPISSEIAKEALKQQDNEK